MGPKNDGDRSPGGGRGQTRPPVPVPADSSAAPSNHPPPRLTQTGGWFRPNRTQREPSDGVKGCATVGKGDPAVCPPPPPSGLPPEVWTLAVNSGDSRRVPGRCRNRQRPRALHANPAKAPNARSITPRAAMPSMPTKGGAHSCHRFGIGTGMEKSPSSGVTFVWGPFGGQGFWGRGIRRWTADKPARLTAHLGTELGGFVDASGIAWLFQFVFIIWV
jgi:hypothetical protein